MQSYLAVFRGNCFAGVSVHEAVYAVLKLLSNQSAIFPAALGIGQTHPLAQELWFIGGRSLMTMSCSLNEKNVRKMIATRTVLTEMMGKKFSNLQGKSEDPGVFPVFVAVNNKNNFNGK